MLNYKLGNWDVDIIKKKIFEFCPYFCSPIKCTYGNGICFAHDKEDRKPCLNFGIYVFSTSIENKKERAKFIDKLVQKYKKGRV